MASEHRINSSRWWDSFVSKYLDRGDLRDRPAEFIDVAARISSGPVLEVGPAFGMFTRYLPSRVQYMGVEISPELVKEARQRQPGATFVCGNVINMAAHQWGQAFNHTCAFQVLEHFNWSDFTRVMDKIKMLTRTSLFFSVPRGIPGAEDAEVDGHIIGWTCQEDMEQCLAEWGTVTWLPCDNNHLMGELYYGQ